MAAEIAHSHHEQWDGSGYPQGLKGDQIPMSAQILGIADIYDVLRSERAYKPAFCHQKIFQILTAGDDRLDSAKHFFCRICSRYSSSITGNSIKSVSPWRIRANPE